MIQIDMPMPDNCVECRFSQSDYGFCSAMPENFCGHVNDFEKDGRPKWCPLKAQEPRVISEVELREIQDETPVWIEVPFEGCDFGHWVLVSYHHYEYKGLKYSFDEGALDGMGVKWRCWTSRPTDEQREAEPWN